MMSLYQRVLISRMMEEAEKAARWANPADEPEEKHIPYLGKRRDPARKFNLADNHRPDPNFVDPWVTRSKYASRGSKRPVGASQWGHNGISVKVDLVLVPAEFGKAIRAWRKERKMSIREAGVALQTGTESQHSSLESDTHQRKLPRSTFERVARAIGFEVSA